ncbi:MAG: TadE/TadG family type IV pilus assembly protein [Acidimicrobiales bacterium]
MNDHGFHPRGIPFSGDGGAAMIEFALVLPVLAVFMLGTLEFGLAWRDKTAIANALRNAGRTDANLSGNRDRRAEYYALDQFKTATMNLPRITCRRSWCSRPTAQGRSSTRRVTPRLERLGQRHQRLLQHLR